MNDNTYSSINDDNTNLIKNLEERVSRLERQLNIISEEKSDEVQVQDEEEELEMRIGKNWLPKIGVFIFFLGVAFTLTLPFEGVNQIIPPISGYVLALIIAALGLYTKNKFEQISGYLIGGSASIAFLSTLRLHFFSTQTFLSSWEIELVALLFVAYSTLWYSLKYESSILTSLGLFLGFFSSLTVESRYLFYFILLLNVLISGGIFFKKKWQGQLIFSTILTYFTMISWFTANPFIKNTNEFLGSSINFIFILVYMVMIGLALLFRKDNSEENFTDIFSSLINAALGYGMFLIISLLKPNEVFGILHLSAAIVLISFAIFFWMNERSQYSTFIYAMTGYAALSVSIIYQFASTWNYILLCWQSLLVVSTAVWFRSKFIVVANYLIFFIVLIAYLFNNINLEPSAISFGIVALLSARILNLQQARLELKTDMMRISYLLIALFWNPYWIYCNLPATFVGFALIALALAYFGIGKLINNLKYRWMAVMTLLITVLYLMIFGITNPDVTNKILSFLIAGIVLVATSVVFGKIKTQKKL